MEGDVTEADWHDVSSGVVSPLDAQGSTSQNRQLPDAGNASLEAQVLWMGRQRFSLANFCQGWVHERTTQQPRTAEFHLP